MQLLNYFDENKVSDCGSCDVCLSKKKNKKTLKSSVSEITSILKSKGALSSKEICTFLNENDQDVLAVLKIMLDKELILLNSQQKFNLK